MPSKFRTVLFGYSKRQVRREIERMLREHEDAMALKQERFVEVRDRCNIMNAELAEYRRKDAEIAAALVHAHEYATEIMRTSEKESTAEKAKLLEGLRELDDAKRITKERLQDVIHLARECTNSFEQDLTELFLKNESFLKSTFRFEKE